jgi:hypothetical protein
MSEYKYESLNKQNPLSLVVGCGSLYYDIKVNLKITKITDEKLVLIMKELGTQQFSSTHINIITKKDPIPDFPYIVVKEKVRYRDYPKNYQYSENDISTIPLPSIVSRIMGHK